MSSETEVQYERLSDVDGYTIVFTDDGPRVHLLRPYNECNTEKSKSGKDTVRLPGISREELLAHLSGYEGKVTFCKRCSPQEGRDDQAALTPNEAPVYTELLEE